MITKEIENKVPVSLYRKKDDLTHIPTNLQLKPISHECEL
jgi:hypothetical protein